MQMNTESISKSGCNFVNNAEIHEMTEIQHISDNISTFYVEETYIQ